MQTLTTLVTLTWLLTLTLASPERSSSSRLDAVDVDAVLSNGRVLTAYIKCLMEEGPCSADGRELRKTLPDALQTGCAQCSPKQRTSVGRVIRYVREHRSEDWRRLTAKYDPTGAFKDKYESLLS